VPSIVVVDMGAAPLRFVVCYLLVQRDIAEHNHLALRVEVDGGALAQKVHKNTCILCGGLQYVLFGTIIQDKLEGKLPAFAPALLGPRSLDIGYLTYRDLPLGSLLHGYLL